MKLFLKTFRLVGIEKDYEFDFKMGLNFISGPTSTGKTTILELIDYALGADKHKSYIEVGSKCTDVELEIILEGTLYRIKRTLFEFTLPVLVEIFDDQSQKFLQFGIFSVDDPSNEKSLSNFLLSKLGLSGVKISNQTFSFRDLFKYSYLKQTKIDSEDMLSEKNWPVFNKEKATFEIIFNFYDTLLGELKATLKKKQEELKEEKLKYEGIDDFLKGSGIENFESVRLRRVEIEEHISELNKVLLNNKELVEKQTSKSEVNNLSKATLDKKKVQKEHMEDLQDQDQYIQKLRLLFNQYENDIEKIDATIMGIKEINKYGFVLCPNCLKPIENHISHGDCSLCGGNMEELVENTLVLKNDRKNIVRKKNELDKHILFEVDRRRKISKEIDVLSQEILQEERLLNELTEKYVNPFVSEISLINMNLGKYYKELDELDDSLRFIKELNRLALLLMDKGKEVSSLREQIEEQAVLNDKSVVMENLSIKFEEILRIFRFPKLEGAYINSKNYLPYVRGRKYNDLGSLGAVTLITMAYYLSILVENTNNQGNHLNLLMIDTPRKNLGISSSSEEFQDEEIYNSIIRYFIELDEEFPDQIQLIVINNGYPDFLPREDIILEFSSNGQSGLIDDV
ncbi:AAA family ATPase [Enterococcus sp. DIV0756]|uniref:AAA family ATPase n=1 Tax=Enterococcus sp. DIV0756 TaxID=2774636 RepID=UPI003F288577